MTRARSSISEESGMLPLSLYSRSILSMLIIAAATCLGSLPICTHFFTLLSPVVLVQKPLWLQRYRFFLIYAREKCRLQKKCRKICVCGEKVVIPKAWRVAGDADPCVSVGGCDQPPIVLHKRFLTHGNRAPVAV